MFSMVLKYILCTNVTQIICLFFIHSLNKAFYFQECRPTLITLMQSRLLDVSCKPLSGRPIINQSILTSDIDKLDYRVFTLLCLRGSHRSEAYGTSKKWGLFPTGVGNKHSVCFFMFS